VGLRSWWLVGWGLLPIFGEERDVEVVETERSEDGEWVDASIAQPEDSGKFVGIGYRKTHCSIAQRTDLT
jgi:hypothetical protein